MREAKRVRSSSYNKEQMQQLRSSGLDRDRPDHDLQVTALASDMEKSANVTPAKLHVGVVFDGERESRQPFLIVAPLSSIAAFIPFRVS